MAKLFWSAVAVFLALSALLALGVFQGHAEAIVAQIVYGGWSLVCPLSLLLIVYAPGLISNLTGDVGLFWRRLQTRRRDIDELKRKIEHLGKAHHMVLLGNTYWRQGRTVAAAKWLERALETEPDLLEARYRLALCRFDLEDFQQAADLLAAVCAEKTNYDYGFAELRLAQAYQRLGEAERAEQAFEHLLRFYPGQPEGSYHYALLKAAQGDREAAQKQMRDILRTVRLAPPFQRRRNRHWALKARWWLLRNR